MRCDGSPNPFISSELNTYMNLWREDTAIKSISEVLNEITDGVNLVNELIEGMDELSLSEGDNSTEVKEERNRQASLQLQQLVSDKLDETTMYQLAFAHENADPDQLNFKQSESSHQATICLWANLSKNPRVKALDFEERSFSIELPRLILLANIGIRVMYTKFDYLSPKCRTFNPKPRRKIVKKGEDKDESNENGNEAEGQIQDDEKSGTNNELTEVEKKLPNESENVSSSVQIPALDFDQLTESVENAENNENVDGEHNKDIVADDDEESVYEEIDDDLLDDDDNVVDLRAYRSMGGCVYIDLIQLPPQRKKIKNWIIRETISPGLQRQAYPFDASKPVTPAQTSSGKESASTNSPSTSGNSSGSLLTTMQLPQYMVFSEPPQLARWDDKNACWRFDGFNDVKYDEATKMIAFKIDFFGPIAIMQDKYLNLPFQFWEYTPLDLNHGKLLFMAAITEFEVEIKDDVCRIKLTAESPKEIELITDKWMSPQELMKCMEEIGIDVFPTIDSDKYVSINPKKKKLEFDVYRQIALTGSAYSYSWSKWNTEADSGRDSIILRGVENLTAEEALDYKIYMINRQRASELKITEESDEYSESPAEGTHFHSDLYHMITDGATQDSLTRIRNSSFLFVDNLYTWLSSTRLFAFS
ncbi:Protein CASC1 [Trichoplax sp. H2]|nr:Protein CASC1 [Trichoplax sp. H2]|eukprot:RDD38910.1 Protein CASC1 [Trichoplax sp. H2]